MFTGSITALITPFRNGKVDEDAFAKLVERQIAQGTNGLVPCGTTGESPTLSHDEHRRVTEICIEVAKKRVPVIAGCGSNSTDEAIGLMEHAQKAGADAALIVTPYYNKPTQEGLYQHFKALHDAVPLPIIIYNIPGRSVVDMTVDTMARLNNDLPRIIGVKDATGDVARTTRQRRACGPDFLMLSGEDITALGFNAHGGRGCISVTSNIAPKLCAEFQAATLKGDFAKALQLQDKLAILHDAMFVETSPGPVKYAASLLGLCAPDMRLPMAPVSERTREVVKSALSAVGLLG
ncbi:MAG: 4-hydroxy-tetrahydrodipicolinate synthase [Proteobacteria bacterium]|jgi:4-hydroxy-tetrahydrodipicolinate synthase|nr:MAG: 4-hydroxy-tetrahydrodipicolinate synthase [Pseudomonadota bacterium]